MADLTGENVEKVLKEVRPFLEIDGGGVELVRILNGGIVEVRLTGACMDCPLSLMTLRAGIERALMHEIPTVTRIESVK